MSDRLRLILGVKLKRLRQERRLGLKEVAAKAGVSVSYLSEIEKGKKYPKPERLVALAAALGVPYDDLVSLRVERELVEVKDAIDSPFLQAFPFHVFGIEAQDVVALMAGVPGRSGALFRAFLDIGRAYDARVEHFLFAALRAYQQQHANHFPELEDAADAFRKKRKWDKRYVPTDDDLRAILETEYGYRVEFDTLEGHPELGGFRAVYAAPRGDEPPTLFVHRGLRPEQRAFLYAREIGFHCLKLTYHPPTASWLRVERFEQVLDNFRASYFAGALLIPREALDADLKAFFARDRWDDGALADALARYRATPEMLFYRLTQRVPTLFGLDEIFFLRFHAPAGTDALTLTKVLNLSREAVPHGIEQDEHYCRRWPGAAALRVLSAKQAEGVSETTVAVQRSHFLNSGAEFFVIAAARPLALQEGTNASVSIGFVMNAAFKRTVRFWNDPSVPRVEVNLTCERCPLLDCAVRAAEPVLLRKQEAVARQERAVRALVSG